MIDYALIYGFIVVAIALLLNLWRLATGHRPWTVSLP